MDANYILDNSQYLDNIRIFVQDKEQAAIIHSIVAQLLKNCNIVAIYLYGSYARSEQKPYSDIDIAVITSTPNPERSFREWIGSYSSKKIDVQVFSDLPLSARMEVLTQGKTLYVQNDVTLRDIIKSVVISYMDLEPMRNRFKRRILGTYNGT